MHWIQGWLDREPDPSKKLRIILDMLKRGLTTGDAAPRFDVLRRLCSILWPEELLEGIPEVEDFPEDEQERLRVLAEFVGRMGVKGIDDYPVPIICGQCALVCGPTLEDTAERYRILAGSGLVVPGPGGRMTRVDTFDEARELRERYPLRVSARRKLRDTLDTFVLWHKHYFGLEPKSFIKARMYKLRLRRALRRAGIHH